MLLRSGRRFSGAESSKLSYEGSTPSRTSIPFFKSLADAQEYLDYEYSLPFYRLVKHYKGTSNIKLVVDNTK